MTGLDGVIARVGEIESRIVALDPAARAASVAPTEATQATRAVPATETSAGTVSTASRFAELLEAVKSAATEPGARSEGEADADASSSHAPASAAETVSALQSLFAVGSGASTGASSLSQYTGLIG